LSFSQGLIQRRAVKNKKKLVAYRENRRRSGNKGEKVSGISTGRITISTKPQGQSLVYENEGKSVKRKPGVNQKLPCLTKKYV